MSEKGVSRSYMCVQMCGWWCECVSVRGERGEGTCKGKKEVKTRRNGDILGEMGW